MERLKNENLKKIEIKIEGDNCIISYPSSKVHSINEAPSFPQLDNELKSTIDLNLSLSSNSDEDFISNLKDIKRKNKDCESNSKKKLEITNKSIFYSESNLKISSSNRNIKINKKNNKDNKNKEKETIIKNSVIKKLNFDLFENYKDLDKNKKLSESDRIKNKSNFLYKNKNLNNINNDINNIITNNKCQNKGIKKRRNSMVNSELQINKKENNLNKINLNINQSFIRHKQNNSFVISNPFNNNKIIYFNIINNTKLNDHFNYYNIGNMTLNKNKSKAEFNFSKNIKKKFKSPKIYNKKRNIKNNLDKLIDEKSLIKSNCLRFKSTGNFSLSKTNNTSNTFKKNKCKITNEKSNIAIKNNKINKNIKTLSKNNNSKSNHANNKNNKKNMFCIKKPNKKIVPYLTSSVININPKNEKNSDVNKKNENEYCSLRQYYYLKSPYLLNIQPSSATPLTSTNGCTICTNCTNCSTLNTPSTNTSKIHYKSNKEEKNSLMKYYSQNSFLKSIVHNNLNHNINNKLNKEVKNYNLTGSQKKKTKKNIIIKQNSNQVKQNYSYKKPNINKSLKSSKNTDIKKILNKCNTKELKNLLKSKGKGAHKILTERNFNNGIHINNSFNNIENYNDNNSKLRNNDEIKEIKKVLLKNMLDIKLKQNFQNKNSLIK